MSENPKDQNVYSALSTYTLDALNYLSTRSTDIDVRSMYLQKWQEESSDTFVRRFFSKPEYSLVLRQHQTELSSLHSYAKALTALRGNSHIEPHLDNLVGGVAGSRLVDSSGLLNTLVLAILRETNQFDFTEEIFDSEYSRLERELYSRTITLKRITPLLGVAITNPIQIATTVEIASLSNAEIYTLLDTGYQLGRYFPSHYGDMVHETHRVAIKSYISMAKTFGSLSDTERSELDKNSGWALFSSGEVENSIVDALRVFKNNPFAAIGTLGYSESMFGVGISYSHNSNTPTYVNRGQYALNVADGHNFVELLETLQDDSIKNRKFLGVAIRRFSYASERFRYEDKLVDYLIAAEALFLSDMTDKPTESTHRLSERVALFLGKSIDERKQIFRFFKQAYSLRSAIVHGGDPKMPNDINGVQMSLQEFVDKLYGYLKESLLLLVERARLPNPDRNLVDWTSLVLSGGNPKSD